VSSPTEALIDFRLGARVAGWDARDPSRLVSVPRAAWREITPPGVASIASATSSAIIDRAAESVALRAHQPNLPKVVRVLVHLYAQVGMSAHGLDAPTRAAIPPVSPWSVLNISKRPQS
jgi:hypothetical protein